MKRKQVELDYEKFFNAWKFLSQDLKIHLWSTIDARRCRKCKYAIRRAIWMQK